MLRCMWAAWASLCLFVCVACSSSDPDTTALMKTGPSLNCLASQRECNGACVDVQANPTNCGACGKTCTGDQLCDQGTCKAKAQGCSAGLLACNGACIDVSNNPSHCGSCDVACGADKTCTAGTCTCVGGKTACGQSCVDLQSDASHCGACSNTCSGGRSCQQGSCQCPAGRQFCGDACADTQSDSKNCGTCANVCGGGKTCTLGQCTCPTGQSLCGDSCVDIQANPANCGACGMQCSLGQACQAGHCGGGGGPGPDGCMGLAQDLTISEIAAEQTVEIPLMKAGSEVAQAARNTDVVAGRDLTLRVFVTVGTGFMARDISARVFLQNGSTIDSYFAKRTVSASSQAATTSSTFQIAVPKDKVGVDTRYAVELVECGSTGSGMMQSPRFPASDGLPLAARQTGGLKIKLIPLVSRSMQADTSDTALQVYRSYFLAMYPITSIDFSVAPALNVSDDSDWTGMLDQVRAKRQSDAPAADVYYFGVLKPTATLREYCGSACTAGIGYVPQGSATQQASQRAALGLAYGDVESAETMAHEVGHNHGRNHAPCVQGGTISGVDGSYPYANGAIGSYGWDPRTMKLIAPDRTDIMGYCQNKWISDYTYDGLVNRVAQVNGAKAELIDPHSLRTFEVLLIDGRGPRWGIPITEPTLPAGELENAEILDLRGNVIDKVAVYRTAISDIDAASIQVPTPESDWYAVRLADGLTVPF